MDGKLTSTASSIEVDLATRCKASLRSDAWGELWHRYHRLAMWEIQAILPGTPEDLIWDILIETYTRLVRHIRNFDPSRGRLSTFVLRVARSSALDYRRQRTRRPKEEMWDRDSPEPHASARESMPLDLVSQRLKERLAAPERADERQVFEAMFRGMSNAEIVDTYDLSEKVVRRVRHQTLERALQALTEILPEL
ncbi:MAG: sigma-70 family RNA polymerase sigma factor [Bryobacteraceae bacterium]|nr:sigma-70 family RNA polymerase sigma factor [Bryobacteraceae bacterium]